MADDTHEAVDPDLGLAGAPEIEVTDEMIDAAELTLCCNLSVLASPDVGDHRLVAKEIVLSALEFDPRRRVRARNR